MKKDFAMLFIIDKWLVATKEMTADCRGWYLNLILHQYDKGDLPNDIEELANLADVRFSEYLRFQQVFQQVLQHKFKLKDNGRLANDFANEILKSRELFKSKRSDAGKMSSILKKARIICADEEFLKQVKIGFDINVDSTHVSDLLQHMFQLYKDRDRNKDIDKPLRRRVEGDKGLEKIKMESDTEQVFEALQEKFGIGEYKNITLFKELHCFCMVLQSKQQIPHFIEQFKAYQTYKAKAQEKTHNFKGFIGTIENSFEDGGWCADNWVHRLNNYKDNGKQTTDYGKLKADSVERMAAIVRSKHGNGNQQPVEGDSGA